LLLQQETLALLSNCAFADDSALDIELVLDPSGKRTLDYSRNFVLVVLATTNTSGDPMVLRFVVHSPMPTPFRMAVPGLEPELIDTKSSPARSRSHLLQVFLSPVKGARLTTALLSTQQSSPIEAQMPDFVRAALDPTVLLPLLQGVIPPLTRLGAAAGLEEAPKRPLVASLSRISLPHPRAEVKVQDVIKVPQMLSDDSLRQMLTSALQVKRDVETPPGVEKEAIAVSQHLYSQLLALINGDNPEQWDPQTCTGAKWETNCWQRLADVLAIKAVEKDACNNQCTGESQLVLQRYQRVLPSPNTVNGASTLLNIPPARVSFGLMGGVFLNAGTSAPRAKIDSGKLAEDPIPYALTIAAIQFHAGHDPTLTKMSRAERVRLFVGTVLTPSIGVAMGGGWAPVRNLSLNIGYAVMLIRTPKDTEQFGEAPKDKDQPFDAAAGYGPFFSLGYKLK
jgi:hypothetical protein